MRRYYDYRWRVGDFFRTSRLAIFLFATAIIIGVVFGCLSGSNIVGTISGTDVSDYTVAWYIGSKSSFGGYFGAGLLDFFVTILLILVCSCCVYFLPGNFILALLKGYLIGYNSFVIIGYYSIGGIFQIVFVFLPQQILIACVTIYCSVCAVNRCLHNRGCPFWVVHGVEYRPLLRKILGSAIIFLIINTILSALFALIMGKLVI